MLSDKLMIEFACDFVYQIDLLLHPRSNLLAKIYKKYPGIKIKEIQNPYADTNLTAVCIEDVNSKDVGVIFQGSTSINNWKSDNLDIFLNKNVDQYDAALDYITSLVDQNIHVTHISGNSLGGGCAQYVGLRFPHIRALCVNAAPLTKDALLDSSNIINIRVKADPLYRAIMLDLERYRNSYAGQIFVVAQSLYGSYDYYNTIELAHRGSIIFPITFLANKYHIKTLPELKKHVDRDEYMQYYQLTKAPNLAQFLSFDLITNNLTDTSEYDLSVLEHNFNIRSDEIILSIDKYFLKNLELARRFDFLKINNKLNNELRNILRYSLLQITKKDEGLYNNIYFVIEKSSNYFYRSMVKNLQKQVASFDKQTIAQDFKKVNADLKINQEAISHINERLDDIKASLRNLNHQVPTNFFKTRHHLSFKHTPTKWHNDYKTELFEVIDQELRDGISNNKFLIGSIEGIFKSALQAQKLIIKLMPKTSKHVKTDDIDFILHHYNVAKLLSKAMEVFKDDFYELLLSESYFYKYVFNIRLVNEQYEQVLITLENLANYVEQAHFKYRDKRINSLIEETRTYIKALMAFNYHNIEDYRAR
jgi:hypothetical protein